MARRAIVVGAGIAGLLAARALRDRFDEVVVLDKDELPGPERARKAVPQGNHIHVIWSGGAAAIERLLPGVWDELLADGAIAFDNSRDMRWFHRGVWKLRVPTGFIMYSQSRPLLEYRIRQRLLALGNVEVRPGCVVGGLTWQANHSAVNGVQCTSADGLGQTLAAELVVDATGRGSHAPEWLEQHGYRRPPESTVGIDLKYASRLYAVPANATRDWQVMAVYGGPPEGRRSGVIFPIEGGRWIVTLAGCLGDHPPGDEAGFLEFARRLDQPDLHAAIVQARPLSPIAVYGFPQELRRRYESLARVPGNFLVVGDAACAFNPLYGQGVSVCALDAEVLLTCVTRLPALDDAALAALPREYYRAAAPVTARAWLLATSTDLLFPAARGRRPPGLGLFGWYHRQILEAGSSNEAVLRRFLEVLHFLKPPSALFAPDIIARACRWALVRR
jgi:2-polyprenyl-6-methoxyphenol hydroxylase-like FAD-dependent oxidoreductase